MTKTSVGFHNHSTLITMISWIKEYLHSHTIVNIIFRGFISLPIHLLRYFVFSFLYLGLLSMYVTHNCTFFIQLMEFTPVFVDTRLSKRKHPRKRFQNFRQSCVLSRSEGHTSGCDWWISIRSVDNMHDWRKFWKRFRGCFVFESRVSTKTVVIQRTVEVIWQNSLSMIVFILISY